MEKPNIGIIGMGFLGSAIAHGFGHCANIKIYDKYNDIYDSLPDVVAHSRYMFVGVPTPMNADGSQDLSSVDNVIKSIASIAYTSKVIIIKTTILPGTTRRYAKMYTNHAFVHNPEFLTERRSKLEFINAPRIILGGEDYTTKEVEELYRIRFTHTPIYRTTWEAAEVAKYMANCFYACKVAFMNEMYDVADHVNIPYEDLKNMFLASGWVNPMHTDVPGHDGQRGYGGKCFPKDMNAIIKWTEENDLGLDMCRAAEKVNKRVRKTEDWKNIKGATSDNDYGKKEGE